MARNWGSNGGATTGVTTGAQTSYEKFAKNYNGVFLVAVGLAIGITSFEVMFSKAGGAWSIVNYYIGWACVGAWAFLVFHPKGPGPVLFLAIAGFNAPWNELDDILTKLKLPDFKLKEMGEQGWEFLQMKYFVLAGHVALYLVLQSMVLATFNVTHGVLVPGILLGFIGFGLWAALLTKAVVWYARIVFLTLAITTGYAAVGAFAPEPSKTEAIADKLLKQNETMLDGNNAADIAKLDGPAAAQGTLTPEQERKLRFAANGQPIHKRVVSYVEERLGVIKIEYQVPSNIAPENMKSICGIPNGDYTMDLADNTPLRLNVLDENGVWSQQYMDLKDYTRISGAFPDSRYPTYGVYANSVRIGEKIRVTNGCISPSFNLRHDVVDWFRKGTYKIDATVLKITLN